MFTILSMDFEHMVSQKQVIGRIKRGVNVESIVEARKKKRKKDDDDALER